MQVPSIPPGGTFARSTKTAKPAITTSAKHLHAENYILLNIHFFFVRDYNAGKYEMLALL